MLQTIDPELVATGIAFLVGAVDALRRYRQDEEVRLHQLPWLEFKSLFLFARRRLFTVSRPSHPTFEVAMSPSTLAETLGRQGVKPKHPFSYRYKGEVYNGVLYVFNPEKNSPHRQVHIRAFQDGEKLEVMCHSEPHWYHHPVQHLKSNDMEIEKANEFVKRRLEKPVPVDYDG